MKKFALASVVVIASACIHRTPELPSPIPRVDGETRTAFALRYIDVATGDGALVAPRKCIYAHYTGWLTDGKKFDSSRDSANGQPREPISFPQGARRVIAGWDVGFEGMRVGARRRLFIPYQLAYGEAGRPPRNSAKVGADLRRRADGRCRHVTASGVDTEGADGAATAVRGVEGGERESVISAMENEGLASRSECDILRARFFPAASPIAPPSTK
jgi:peptidylprolyl isomerase